MNLNLSLKSRSISSFYLTRAIENPFQILGCNRYTFLHKSPSNPLPIVQLALLLWVKPIYHHEVLGDGFCSLWWHGWEFLQKVPLHAKTGLEIFVLSVIPNEGLAGTSPAKAFFWYGWLQLRQKSRELFLSVRRLGWAGASQPYICYDNLFDSMREVCRRMVTDTNCTNLLFRDICGIEPLILPNGT